MTARVIAYSLVFASLTIAISATRAAEPARPPQTSGQGGVSVVSPNRPASAEPATINLMMGFVETYTAKQPFKSIQIGDPKIIEVNATSDRTLTLLPVSNGLTNILFMDDKGETIDSIIVWVNEAGANRVEIVTRPSWPRSVFRCGDNGCMVVRQPPPPVDTPQVERLYSTCLDRATDSFHCRAAIPMRA
jgi:Flp pilus assembly secretin CpaC